MRPIMLAQVILTVTIALAACRQSSTAESQRREHPRNDEVAAGTRSDDAQPRSTRSWTEINLAEHPARNTVKSHGVKVTFRAQGRADDLQRALAHVEIPSFPAIDVRLVKASARWPIQVGIGKLNRSDAAPSVLIQSYWGGAHCCFVFRAVVPAKAKLRVVDFPLFDPISKEENLVAFPHDLDHDGYGDIVLDDVRFDDRFGSHGGTWSPPLIFNIVNGQLIDVSSRPAFADLFKRFAKKARAVCAHPPYNEPAGACAGYAAAAARLGRPQQGIREAVKFAKTDGFEADLRRLLKETGYIDQSKSDEPLHCRTVDGPDDSTPKFEAVGRLC